MNPIQTIAGRFGGGQGGKRARKTLAIAFVALLAFSVVAPFLGFVALDGPDHGGTAEANHNYDGSDDSIYVGTQGNDIVEVKTGGATGWSITGNSGVNAIEFGADGDLRTTGYDDARRITRSGSQKWSAASTTSDDFISTHDSAGNAYFYDSGNDDVLKIDGSGTETTFNASASGTIGGMTIGPDGHLWLAKRDGGVFKYDTSDGSLLWNSSTSATGIFRYNDNLLVPVSGSYGGSTRLIDSNGNVLDTYGVEFAAQPAVTENGNLVGREQSTNDKIKYNVGNKEVDWRNTNTHNSQDWVIGPEGHAWATPGVSSADIQKYNITDGTLEFTATVTGDEIRGISNEMSVGYGVGGVSVSGTVTDSDGNALEGAKVTLEQSGTLLNSTTTSASGGYEFTGVKDGDYTVTAENDGYHTGSSTITVSGSAVTQDFSLDPVLVTGEVTKPGGSAIEDAKVTLEQSGTVVESTRTNASGGYRFSTVTDGAYTVAASADGHHDEAEDISVSRATVRQDFALSTIASGADGNGQAIGLVEDGLGMFPPGDTELIVHHRKYDYSPLWRSAFSVEEWREKAWEEESVGHFNWENRTYVNLTDGDYYRLEIHSTHGTWEDSGFRYDKSEMLGSTVWLRPDTGHLDSNSDGTAGGDSSSGTNGPGTSSGSDSDSDSDSTSGDSTPTATEDTGFGPTAIGECTTVDGQDGVEVEYWDPGYETYELRANLSVDGESTYFIHKTFDDARGYYRGCLADVMTNNASSSRDTEFSHNATNLEGGVVSSGSTSYSPPIFGPSGVAPASTGERLGLLAGVLGALGVLWVGGNRYVPGTAVEAWPVDSVSPAFGVGAPLVTVLGLDLAGGGVISASVATGLAQIAPFAGIVGVTVAGYYALRWIRAPPS